jgi:hypothetical protein
LSCNAAPGATAGKECSKLTRWPFADLSMFAYDVIVVDPLATLGTTPTPEPGRAAGFDGWGREHGKFDRVA